MRTFTYKLSHARTRLLRVHDEVDDSKPHATK